MYAYVFLWLSLVGRSLSTCGPSPIAIPITNVDLSNGHYRRGIQGQVGTPAQNVSFMIHTYLNDTWIYNATQAFCDDMDVTTDQCVTLRGGLYNTDGSSTYVHQANVRDAGADPSDTARALGTHIWDSTWANDDFVLGNATLSNYAIGMPGFDFGGAYNRQAAIGLGHNSTILQSLKDRNSTASRSWSYWWGIDNSASRSAMGGQIVFGGYDAAKVTGEPFTQQLQEPSANCQSGMYLTLTNMLLNFPNGTSSDLNPSSVITGCLQPDFPAVMTIPAEPYFWRFQNVTETAFMNKSSGTYWFMPEYPSSDVYAGDLEIQIQGGPAINIPNDVLVVPDQYVDSNGAVKGNSSAATLLISPNDGPNVNDVPLIGMAFFSGAYLTVDLDNRTWSVWPAKATTDTNLIAIGGSCGDATNITSQTTGTDNSHTSSTPHHSDGLTPAHKSSTLSTGVITGIAVGGSAAALSAVGLIVFFVLRRRRKSNRSREEDASIKSFAGSFASHDPIMKGHVPMQEMAGSQTAPYELRSDEKPVELAQQRCTRGYSKRSHAFELPVDRYH